MSHHPDALGPDHDPDPTPGAPRTPEPLSSLEARLRGWAPAPAPAVGPARDRLFYEAGRAAAHPIVAHTRDRRLILDARLAAAVLLLTSLALGGLLARERGTQARLRGERAALVAQLAEYQQALSPTGPSAGGGRGTQVAQLGGAQPPAASSYLVLSRHPEALGARPLAPGERTRPVDLDPTPPLTPLRARSDAAWLDL